MKTILTCTFALLVLCLAAIEPLKGSPLDYSKKSNWMIFTEKKYAKQKVDLLFLYPTCVSSKCKTTVSEVDEEMRKNARYSYIRSAECLADITNVYAPYYRQISGTRLMEAITPEQLEKECRETEVRTDVYAALDYYFKNVNQGKPFILAGHSQGSCNLKIVLSEYMKEHPEYLKRMVACYAIGFYFPEVWFKANPHIRKATGETDIGVFISWNSEGPGGTMPNICIGDGSFTINPLNWKTDETPAKIEENLGSLSVDPKTLKTTIVPGKVSAKIDLKRGALVCEGCTDYAIHKSLFGDKSFHMNDWDFYYVNIRKNAQKRIEAYLKK